MPDKRIVTMIAKHQQKTGELMPLNSLLLLNLLKQGRRMTTEAINKELRLPEGRVRATAERLTEDGLLEAIGNGRGRAYILSSKMYRDPAAYVRQTDIDQLRHRELILKLAQTRGSISRKDVIELLHINGPQAYRLLRKLVEDNELVLEGNTSAARYKISDR
jgi:ATP-dependent DNA helicase RecG